MKRFVTKAMLCALFCTAAALSLLAGCANSGDADSADPSAPVRDDPRLSSPSESAASASSRPADESAPPIDPTARFALENYDYQQAELENYRSIGAQFYTEHMRAEVRDVPYDLAAAIYRYRDYHNSLIFSESFSDITALDPATLIEIAVARAPHIDLFSESFLSATEAHPIKQFYLAFQEQSGLTPGLLAYGDNVRAKAKELFGAQYELPRQDGLRLRYEPTLDLYYCDSPTATLSTDYPIVVEWKRADDIYTVRVIRMSFWEFQNSWSTPDGSWESPENCAIEEVREYVNTNFHAFPQDTYRLTGPDRDSLRVIGFTGG